MSQWDKLIEAILNEDTNLRFEDLYKALVRLGYTPNQPKGGSSHYTFRKTGCMPVTIPKHTPINKAYIALIAKIIHMDPEEDKA